jgi:PhzF family phenazine biosynthesis protein
MSIPIYQVDAFTAEPFHGNPAAVCLLDAPASDQWMQQLAAEMNLSETAFLWLEGEVYRLRWFTPAVEVDLCGHATLASAHVLWETGRLAADQTAHFQTRSGLLTADLAEGWIELDFPATPPILVEAPPDLIRALGVRPLHVAKSRFDYLVEVALVDDVRSAKPDHALLRSIDVRGVMVTSRGEGEFDFVSRFFAPGSGIDEDPVTGSAHCCLAPYWAEKLDRDRFTAYQASPRGGVRRVALDGHRVRLSGQAVTVLGGELAV